MSKMLRFPNKEIRASVIADYIRSAGYRGAVVFSCGNASRALKDKGIYVIEIAPAGDLRPGRWWLPEDIYKAWPELFDATSGHLPAHLMVKVALAFRDYLGVLERGEYMIPTGSGETITCLRWVYPSIRFTAIYGVDEATAYEPSAPLNLIVTAGGETVIKGPSSCDL